MPKFKKGDKVQLKKGCNSLIGYGIHGGDTGVIRVVAGKEKSSSVAFDKTGKWWWVPEANLIPYNPYLAKFFIERKPE